MSERTIRRLPGQGQGDDIVVRDVEVEFPASGSGPFITVNHVELLVPEPAFRQIVASAASRAGVNARGSLATGQVSVAVSVSLLRLTATFGAMVENGHLILEPQSGLPGWLLGRAATIVGRTPGITMSSHGRITVDPAAFVPVGIRLRTGFTAIFVDAGFIRVTLG